MGQSYRIKTELGVNKTINLQLDQDFEFLEILSLKIQQTDVYSRSCADYGVLVGRITANGGLGLPNARVSVFIPITTIDESNPLISSIYPYKSPTDKNDDGYRYNLLPYEKSYSKHASTGTLPSRSDVLTGSTAVEIFDKYYKFTAKTNESGDYMIMGVPLGNQTIVMDVDLSDIGEFSLTPQDLIRMGLATEAQVAGNKFRSSTDLISLPQIINIVKGVEISPLWGDPTTCQIAINRLDFDLRDEANVDIQPTSVFMGSMFSSSDKYRIKSNCKPKDNMGNLCGLTTSPGQILAIRQTIYQDSEGNPTLEQYDLEQAGNVIDGSGTWLVELPMNLDYFITNEFGEKILSNDPAIGIPTKAKYRFKVKWTQPNDLTLSSRRPYYLVPNIKEYGWTTSTFDPTINGVPVTSQQKRQQSSYYFGLSWSGYTNGFIGQQKIDKLTESIECGDTFYQFEFNKVYTVSSFIDQWKKGGTGKFIGIKEIDSQDCEDTVNKFPVNDGFKNFDFLFFLFSIIFTVLQPIGINLLIVAHLIIFIYNLFIGVICAICRIGFFGIHPFRFICNIFNIDCPNRKDFTIRLPMITYPACEACECSQTIVTTGEPQSTSGGGILSFLSQSTLYSDAIEAQYFSGDTENGSKLSIMYSEALAGLGLTSNLSIPQRYKLPISQSLEVGGATFVQSYDLPVGERINVFNQRNNFFTGGNKVKVTIAENLNYGKYHYDNTITVLSQEQFSPGTLLTFVSVSGTTDINYTYSAVTASGTITGISGESYNNTGETTVSVSYAINQSTNSTPIIYNLPYGSDNTNYRFPADIEYFQVVTAITVSNASKIWNTGSTQSFGNILSKPTICTDWGPSNGGYRPRNNNVDSLVATDYFEGYQEQYILVLQRGVDPYSPMYKNVYYLGGLFGTNDSDPNWTITADTRINIPIQKLDVTNISIQPYNQNGMYYQSYFFKPGTTTSSVPGQSFTGYSTTNTAYYGSLDFTTNPIPIWSTLSGNEVISKTTNGFYSISSDSVKYDNSEDLSGLAIMGMANVIPIPYGTISTGFNSFYYSKIFTNGESLIPITISNSQKNILRTDRLPSSDSLDGGSWGNNPSLLQQNLNFAVYEINTINEDINSTAFSTGAQTVTVDLEGYGKLSENVLTSFTCEQMVGLTCYQGFGDSFKINTGCTTTDAVENGCYMFLRKPLIDLFKDLGNFAEWGFRFRFFYALCRGVLSQSFMNNWVNGSLYAFPIQVDTIYDAQNKPKYPKFCSGVTYFNMDSNNFYYRSSPWNDNTNKFVGKTTSDLSINKVNLLFPTTIVNLGMKDYFYSEITFDPATKAYIMPNIDSTSYSDNSDLVNLFVISRITDESFLGQILSLGDNGINQLFSRPEKRVDGDFAQLASINSEIGNISFSPEFYETTLTNSPTTILGTPSNPAMAVWFSSTTQDLQTKDYLTPGIIDFRSSDNVGYYPYPYGIKSQLVPFYQWELADSSRIFGNQDNNWKIDRSSDIIQNNYQSLDRAATDTKYFLNGTSVANNLTARGYIFSVDGDVVNYPTTGGKYSTTGQISSKFLVGAPYQFYFGVVKGASALDRFKTKYSVDE